MKSYKNYILLIAIVSLARLHSHAQVSESSIKGYVYNAANEPAMYSTVVLLNEDSVQMKGVLSQTDGMFVLEKLNPGNYFVMVRNMEFETYISELLKIQKNENVVLDKIILKTKLIGLDEVVVTGSKAMVEVHPDKMVFNVSSSVNASGSNGLELIGKAPGVIVDFDKNIVLQGKSGVQVYINGRPSRLSGSDLSNMLEGMRSDNIESLEIISNPSAKFDAEGTGGIINIVLKKNVRAGFNGNLVTGYTRGSFGRANIGSSLNYSGEKINLFSSINVSDDIYQDDIVSVTRRDLFLLDMGSYGINHRKGYNVSGGMDYTINEQHAISLDAKVFISDRDNQLKSTTIITDLSAINSPEVLKAQTLDLIPSQNYNLNAHYSFIPDRNSKLSADFSIGSYVNTKDTRQPNEYFSLDPGILLRSVASKYNSDTEIGLMSAKLDYEKKISQATLSGGVKYSYVSTANRLAFYNIEADMAVKDSSRSNNFSYLEKIAAAYVILNVKAGERMSLNAGLRMENTSSLGTLESDIPVNDNIVPRNYTSFFPSLGLSYDDQKNNVFSLSIGRRISRPNYMDLNPFESKMSELTAWKGNPFLRPNYITNYQLSYSFKRKLVISNTYSVTNDFFANVFITVGDKSSILSPRNMQKVINNGLSLSYPLKVFKWWEFTSFFIYNYESYDGNIEGTIINLEENIYNFRMQNTLKLPAGITGELTFYYSSPWIWGGTVNVKEHYSVNFGIKKSFFKDRFLVQLTGNDVLNNSSDFYYNSNYGGMIIKGIRSFDNSRFGFNLTYKFGNQQAKTGKRSRSAMDDELRRISE